MAFHIKANKLICDKNVLLIIKLNRCIINEMSQPQESKQKQPEYLITKKYQYSPDIESKASIWSKIFFIWTYQIIKKGCKKPLEMNDLYDVTDNEEPVYSHSVFSQIYNRVKETPNRLLTSTKNFIGDKFLLAGLLSAIAHSLLLIGPVMIKNILIFIQDGNQPLGEGLFYVTVLILSYVLKAILLQHSLHMVNNNCIKVINAANSLVYHKILSLSSSSLKYLETGSILNFINVDVISCIQFITLSPYLFIGPLMISIAIVLLVMQVGWLGFIVPIWFLLGSYWQEKLLNKGFQIRKKQLQMLDKRSKCINQYFSGIRIIKYYGWQNFVWENIEKIRKQEMILSFSFLIIRTYIEMLIKMLPIVSSIIIFGLYTTLEGGQTFTLAKGFAILSIFNLINNPMRLLVSVSIHYLNTKASMDRLEHFCQYDEKKLDERASISESRKTGQISFQNCQYSWQDQKVKAHAQKQGENKKKLKSKKKLASFVQRNSSEQDQQQMGLRKNLLQESRQRDEFEIELRQFKNPDKRNSLEIKNLIISPGQFVAVVGRVASGKTTFLHAILSEIKKNNGKFILKGSIAYVSQVSWMRSTTIRQNILFESYFDQQKYKNIIKLCQLQADFQVLKGGDLTQIGQKGLNLSGGQKQRIALARALYQDSDIYLIDDCLSALDSYVGKNIFKNVINKHLKEKGKTVILVTNALNYTDCCERVLVMQKGQIIEDGNPKQLATNQKSAYYNLKQQYKKLLDQEENQKRKQRQSIQKRRTTSIDLSQVSFEEQKKQSKQKQLQGLVKTQQRIKGSIPWYFYFRFFTQTKVLTSISLFLFVILCQLARIGNDWWIGQWTQSKNKEQQSYYLLFYVAISFVVGLLMFLRGLFFAKFIIRTTKIIHRKLINSLLKTPLSWFDVTPTGRILARTIKDQYELDNTLPYNLQGSTQNLLVLASAIVLISMATPQYIIIAIISLVGYMKLMKMYLNSSRQIKRLESNCRAPLMSHIQETINGIYVIRAFQKSQNFINKYFQKQKAHIVTVANQNSAQRWIHLCNEAFAIITIACAGYFGIWNAHNSHTDKQNLTMIGLALVWTIQMSSIMSYTIKILADTENNMNSLVRMYEYVDNNPSEYSFDKPKPLSATWPDLGQYSIQNVSYRYRPQLNLVIKNISFSIEPMSKVGIVGRTGCGKSSITLGLLRILQIVENEDGSKGSIVLDQEDISTIGLHYIRHNIAMIPQDPTLFTGTIKSNIDPFDNYSDHEIAYSLKRVNLWEHIPNNFQYKDEIDQKLYSKVQQAGSNYSLGQKQLICMARALIRKPKVLIMDQATASVDEKTDEDIQCMIREEFNETTVITIAHRLNTLIYYDKILVLEKGQVMEYDTPLNLVKNPNSFLGTLIRKTGYTYMKNIIDLAEKSAAAKQNREKLNH